MPSVGAPMNERSVSTFFALSRASRSSRCERSGVLGNLLRILDHRRAVHQLAHLAQLYVGEGALYRAAPREHPDMLDRRGVDHLGRVVGEVGMRHFGGRLGQDAGHVDRHVAGADHRDRVDLEVGVQLAEVGVAVVPADERVGAEHVLLVLAGDAELVVVGCAVGQHDRVVDFLQLGHADVAPDLDIAEIPHIGVRHRLLEGAADVLGGGMVGRNPAADQTERRGQPLDDIDLHVRHELEEPLNDIHAARPGADDGDAA